MPTTHLITSASDGEPRAPAATAALLAALLAIALAAAAGCSLQRTVLDDSVVDTYGGPEEDLDFWDAVIERPVVTNDDALHGLLMLADGADPAGGYDARLAEAKRRGWLDAEASPRRNASASMGMMSVAVCDILAIEGGLMMHLAGRRPRYCTREIVHLGIVPNRTENQSLTGLEFADLVRRVADRRTHVARGEEPPAAAAEP